LSAPSVGETADPAGIEALAPMTRWPSATDAKDDAAHRLRPRLVFCNSCRHQAAADLQALVDVGRGHVPLTQLRFRCSQCHTGRTDFVVTSRDVVKPW
jgi:hypothetical protein